MLNQPVFVRIAQPICWRSRPGWFGVKFYAKFTDGKYRRVSRQTIIDNAYD